METIKHFISKCEDRYRVAYGKRTETFPRQCIFIGTTNNREFLNDPTGNRRFWPIDVAINKPVKNIWVDLNQAEIDQLWAEAVTLYKAGESVFLDKDLELQATEIQSAHTELDERTFLVQEFLDKPVPTNWAFQGCPAKSSSLSHLSSITLANPQQHTCMPPRLFPSHLVFGSPVVCSNTYLRYNDRQARKLHST
jgi:predicted P-loop ATPase